MHFICTGTDCCAQDEETREELQANLQRLEQEINDKQEQLERLEEELQGDEERMQAEFRDHNESKQRWVKRLQRIVQKLDDKFGKLMSQIGNVGKWELGNIATPLEDTKLMDITMHLTASFAARQDGSTGALLRLTGLSVRSEWGSSCACLPSAHLANTSPSSCCVVSVGRRKRCGDLRRIDGSTATVPSAFPHR